MKSRIVLGIWLALIFVAVACGDDDDAVQDGPSIGVGPGISVAEALASELPGPYLVNGFVVAQGDEVRLCAALAESLPPLCAQDSLKVEGLDLSGVAGLKTQQGISWTDSQVQILGDVDGDVLTVSLTSQ